MPQFKKNMRELEKLGDQKTVVEGFNRIGGRMRDQMESKLKSNLNTPTAAYIRAKRGKAMWLRERGIVAKPFSLKGMSKSFVGIDYRFGPHAHWFEFGTGERYTKSGAYRGKIPRSGTKGKSESGGSKRSGRKRIKLKFFRPVVSEWRRSGRFVNEVQRTMQTALKVQMSKMITI